MSLTVIALTALCIFVFPLQLGGCGILGVGVWLSVTQGNFATLSSSLPSLSAANLLIAVGTIIMVIGCLGCVGAVKESRPLLLTVSIFSRKVFNAVTDFDTRLCCAVLCDDAMSLYSHYIFLDWLISLSVKA